MLFRSDVVAFQEVVLEVKKKDVLMDGSLIDGEELIAARKLPIDVDRHGRVREGKVPVDTDPRLVDYRANQIVAFWVCCAGDFTDKVNGGFLNKEDVDCISTRVEEIVDCFPRFVYVLE